MTDAEPPRRLLDFRSGGWVLLLAAALLVGAGAAVLWPVLRGEGRARVGDGDDVASYGFDLRGLESQRAYLAAAGFPKDGLPRWTDRVLADADDVARLNQELREAHVGKALTETDLVIGVDIDGQRRAYPLRFLTVHEICNDQLGDTPLLATYSPLCNSVCVYERRVGGATLEFGVSGLLLHSNPLLFDRQANLADETLWPQLTGVGVSGGARVGVELPRVPHQIAPWGVWSMRHPDTQVVLPARGRYKLYKRVSYNVYRSLGRPQFPARPAPTDVELEPLELIYAVRAARGWEVFPLNALVDGRQVWKAKVDGAPVMLVPMTRESAWVTTEADVVRTAWFAWNAFHPDSRIAEPPPPLPSPPAPG